MDLLTRIQQLLYSSTSSRHYLINSHGLSTLLEVQEYCEEDLDNANRVTLATLILINYITTDDTLLADSLLLNTLPLMLRLSKDEHGRDIRLQAALFL